MTIADAPGWACSCGKTNAADRARCPDCGGSRADAGRPSGRAEPGRASGRVARAPAPPVAPAAPFVPPATGPRSVDASFMPVTPLPRGTPPVRLTSRSLQLDQPRVCCCCLGAPQGTSFQVRVGEGGGFGLDFWDTLVGQLMLVTTGFGWFTVRHEEGMETALRCSVCATCRSHADGAERANMGAMGAVVIASIAVLGLGNGRMPLLAMLACAVGFAVVAGLATKIVLGAVLSVPGPQCSGSSPVLVAWNGQVFDITFANAAYGRRVDEMNPRRG